MTFMMQSLASLDLTVYMFNLAIAVLLACGAGLATVAVLRNQAPPLRHALLVSALGCTLFAPGLVWLASMAGFGVIPISFAKSSAAGAEAMVLEDLPPRFERLEKMPAEPLAPESPTEPMAKARLKTPSAANAPKPAADTHQSRTPMSWWHIAGSFAGIVWLLGTILSAIWYARMLYIEEILPIARKAALRGA